jgi:hypothetical protein
MSGLFGNPPNPTLASLLYGMAKSKVFISYHHGGDQNYYEEFSRIFDDHYDVITDRSLERAINSDDDDYTRWKIRDANIKGTSVTIVLCGAQTPYRKYVDWEIKATLDMQHGLIGIQLPTCVVNHERKAIVPDRLHDNIASGYAIWAAWGALTAQSLQAWIAQARGKSAFGIVNSRELRGRNG